MRAPIELKVEYKKMNTFFSDYTKNISKGGTFIKTKKPLPIGTRFLFKLTVPHRPSPFELLGEVVWSNGDVEEPGMGIRFINLQPDERERLLPARDTGDRQTEVERGREVVTHLDVALQTDAAQVRAELEAHLSGDVAAVSGRLQVHEQSLRLVFVDEQPGVNVISQRRFSRCLASVQPATESFRA